MTKQAEVQKAETEQAETGQAEAGRTESDSVNAQISFNRNIWLRRLVLVLLGLLMGLQIYFVNAGRVMGDPLPMPFGYGAAVVLSGSMEPTYSAADREKNGPLPDWRYRSVSERTKSGGTPHYRHEW